MNKTMGANIDKSQIRRAELSIWITITLSLVVLFMPQESVAKVLGIKGEEATSIGIYIKNIKTGQVIAEHNCNLALTPASVMKCVTVASALTKLGPDWQYETPVRLTGHKDTRNPSVWRGNLEIISCADPTLESDNFKSNKGFTDSIIANIKKLGIKRIEGKVKIIESLKDAGPITKWEIQDIAWAYGTGLFGFNYYDNLLTVWPASGKSSPYDPVLKTVVKKSTSNDLLRGIFSEDLYVYAKDPSNKNWSVTTPMPSPRIVYKELLTKRLRKEGIAIDDKSSSETGGGRTLYTHRSVKAGEIMKSLMFRSDNLFAEGMLRRLLPDGTLGGALKAEREILEGMGLNPEYSYIYDGSGLTRANRIQPIFLGKLLEKMAKGEYAEEYVSYFPKAGKEGTMKNFLSKSKLRGKIAFKTGSVNGVQCYAGYKLDNKGKPTHVAVVMVNGFFCPRAQLKSAIEKYIQNKFR